MTLRQAQALGYTVNVSRRWGGLFPWGFEITRPDGVTCLFVGIQNKMETRRAATLRALWRVRWMVDGSYEGRYA